MSFPAPKLLRFSVAQLITFICDCTVRLANSASSLKNLKVPRWSMQKNKFDELDIQFEDVIARLQSGHDRVPSMPAEFKASLRAQLRTRAAEMHIMHREQRPILRLVPL